MPNQLSSALAAKQKADNLNLGALIKAIGASAPSVTAALRGKSFPNKLTAPKFAKYLGITVEELHGLRQSAPGKSKAKPKPASKAKPAKLAKSSKPGKSFNAITLSEAAELVSDDLAVAVHAATAEQRRVIKAVLG